MPGGREENLGRLKYKPTIDSKLEGPTSLMIESRFLSYRDHSLIDNL